jgi:Protein of unknown function (DUF2950)
MKMNSATNDRARGNKVLTGLLLLSAMGILLGCGDSKKSTEESKPAVQSTFQIPAEAGAALVAAARAGDPVGLNKVLGAESLSILTTGDPALDKEANASFAAKYDKMNRWVDMNDGSKVLYVGADNFAFPIPLAKDSSGKWYFDTKAGALEVKARDIGRNELLAIDACMAVANAQDIYFKKAGPVHEYAQRIISTSGKQDGLYWPVPAGSDSSPLGHLSKFPKASISAPALDEPPTIDGYTLRILTAQGEGAKGGAKNYVVNGKMTGGFAVLATPIRYGETGIMTFVLSREGVVYEQNLGPKTPDIASSIKEYDPAEGWAPIE